MKISIYGLGYVGFVHAIGFAYLGHEVIGYDIDLSKVKAIKERRIPFYEPKLEDLMAIASNRLRAVEDPVEAVVKSDLTLITVGTPSLPDGSADISYVKKAVEMIGKGIKAKGAKHLVVIKSTVPPGTSMAMRRYLESMGLRYEVDFDLAMNPEFLREGSAVEDFLRPDRIVIGVWSPWARDMLLELYKEIESPKVVTDPTTAEFVKYVSNVFLALKISFSNEVGDLCKAMGVDSYEVFRIVGMDKRIGYSYFGSGLGFGGSCFPKDLKAWIKFAESLGQRAIIAEAALHVNNERPAKAIKLLKKHLGSLYGRRIGVLGLSYKVNTDDVRESKGIEVAMLLLKEGARVYVNDPAALNNAKKILGDSVIYAEDPQELLNEVEAVVIATEWPQYETLDYRGKIVVDGRRVKKAKEAKIYEGMTW
ncbi:MAG: UDP-glucose/GDP-mannose dehydrogenase family protein [Sulfolobales archaeon]